MATRNYHNRFLFGAIILFSLIAHRQSLGQSSPGQSKASKPAKPAVAQVLRQPPVLSFTTELALRQAVFDSASRFIGMVEKTNQNDAAWIAMINKANGLPSRSMYCASAYYYVHAINGVKLPVKGVGMVRSYFSDQTRIIYRRNHRGNQRVGRKPRMMDAVSLYASHIEGIAVAHYDPDEDDGVKCIGFNTTGGKGTKGGCYVNWRKTSEIKFIANWLSPYWEKTHPAE